MLGQSLAEVLSTPWDSGWSSQAGKRDLRSSTMKGRAQKTTKDRGFGGMEAFTRKTRTVNQRSCRNINQAQFGCL